MASIPDEITEDIGSVGSQRTGVCCLRVVAFPAGVARGLLLEFRDQALVPGWVAGVPAVHCGQGIPASRPRLP